MPEMVRLQSRQWNINRASEPEALEGTDGEGRKAYTNHNLKLGLENSEQGLIGTDLHDKSIYIT